MKTTNHKRSSRLAPSRMPGRGRSALVKAHGLAKLRARLAAAEEALRAIRDGEVDAVVVPGKQGSQVFTLEGAGHAYRMLIESINEGALTLTAEGVVLYANQCFARMAKLPLEHVLGSSFYQMLAAADRIVLRPLLKRTPKVGFKMPAVLQAGNGLQLPVQISIHSLPGNAHVPATFGMVVTDMTEARHNEERLRTLTRRVVQAQEEERRRVARELHDHITQLLCAILIRSQVLAAGISVRDMPMKSEALKLRDLLGQAAEEVERISCHLRPSVLAELGLEVVLRETSVAFAERTGLAMKLVCAPLTARLPAEAELTLYRILQEALKNVEKHASARHVTVCLRQQRGFVQLVIKDDGMGFTSARRSARRKGEGGLGLLSMRERATYVGGTLQVKSAPRAGTEIEVRIPLTPSGALKRV